MKGCWWALLMLGAPVALAMPVVTGVQVQLAADSETLVLKSSAPLQVLKQFALSDPERIVVDVRLAEGKNITLPKDYRGVLMKNVRFAQYNAERSRLVIETKRPLRVQATRALDHHRLAITLQAASGKAGVAKAPSVKKPSAAPTGKAENQAEEADTEAPQAAPTVAAPTDKAKKLPLIVLDAGHGGQDPGASGIHGIHEKDITLTMVKALRDGLLATGRYRVALTRSDDRYILLPERVNIARRLKADMFISIHADSNPVGTARGLSIYTVSETASDKESQALAERENKSDIIGGLDLNTADKDVANILIDLTQRETATKSLEFADALVASLHPKIEKLPGTHRFAGFRVLKAPDIPSVLIELGFLTNSRDEELLQSPHYRKLLVDSVVRGVDRYRERGRK